ncbi:hypothetical protein DS909_03150 [Phaeobacter gallaeciensis]|uniref:Uncharacterized protein n=1 Tax=Phaeobacter gallaeciensis TaxID=60890 RepID=A0A366XCH4_9RHOB|nr:hypothetical protein DS909_03150 [Phaeobacter gallaeciensis]
MQDLSPSVRSAATLSDVIGRLDTINDLSKHEAQEMASAGRKVASFVYLLPSGDIVEIGKLRQTLEALQPRRFKISERRLRNIRSLFV